MGDPRSTSLIADVLSIDTRVIDPCCFVKAFLLNPGERDAIEGRRRMKLQCSASSLRLVAMGIM